MSCTPSPDTTTKKRRVSFCCSDDPLDKWLNTPTVPVTGLDGMQYNVLADMQPWDYCGFGPTGGCGRPNNWHDFCGQVFDPTGYDPANPPAAGASIPCGTGSGPSVMGTNLFMLNPDYIWKKRCQLPGWKGVAAMPVWPGRYGLKYTPNCCPTSTSQYKYTAQASEFSCSVSGEANYKNYNTSSYVLEGEGTFSGSTFFSDTFTGSVDAFGNRKNTAIGRSGTQMTETTVFPSETDKVVVNYVDECGHDGFDNGFSGYFTGGGYDGYIIDFINGISDLFKVPAISNDCGVFSISWGTHHIGGTADEINAANQFGLAAGAVMGDSIQDFGASGKAYWTRTTTDLVPLSVIKYSDDEIFLQASGTAYIYQKVVDTLGNITHEAHRTLTWNLKYQVKLSGQTFYSDVLKDGEALLAAWNMGDPEAYPWRQDGKVWLLPFVTRDAVSGSPDGQVPDCPTPWSTSDTGYVETPPGSGVYIDTISGTRAAQPREFSENRYTGAIIGAPQEVGKARYFNFNQKVNCASGGDCCSRITCGDNNWFCVSGWGQLSYDPLPKTATQWTDPELGSLLRKGASVVQYGGSVVMTKWAEVEMPWPSVNLARPFGRDRFLIDYADAGLTDDPDCSGGAGVAIATYESFGDICTDNTSFLYAHRKFPTCRPIGSTIGITSAVDNGDGTVTLTTAEKHWICGAGDGHGYTDAVDFYNIHGLGAGVVVETATPGSTTFIVSGSLTSAYSGGGYIATAGMTADIAKWDYTCPRHQFLVQTWDVNPRAYGNYDSAIDPMTSQPYGFTTPVYQYAETQATLTPKSGFSVLLCSPNNDTFPDDNAVYRAPWKDITNELCGLYYFSAAIGNMWICNFVQAVADPFFIMPTKCAADGDTRHFASGPFCSDYDSGTTVLVPYPLVEPMTQLPPGAPDPQVPMTASHDGGIPPNCHVNCSFPGDQTATLAMFNKTYLACTDSPGWQTVTHEKCQATTFPLPDAAGYVNPGNGLTPPEAYGSFGGAGDASGGAGDSAPGAGDSGGGGL